MSRQELSGGAYMARSLAAAAQRSVNLFGEPAVEAEGEPAKAAHYPTPGTRYLNTVGPGPIRGIRQAVTGATYCVSGSGVYKVDPTTWVGTHLGDITPGLRTPVSMVDNGLDMVIVDGSANGWHVTLVGDVFGAIPNPLGTFYGADRVDFLDTYLLFNKPNTPQFYSSDSLALTFDPLWFANKESYSDLLRTLIVVKRDIWLLGDKTTEVWANVGKPDFPFERQADILIDHGIVAKYSVANYDNGVFWLTSDRQGQGIVMMGAGYQTKRISTYAIENEIAGYSKISDAIGLCYQIGGHTFYVLTFPTADKTWVHDITTGLWHEWLWIDTNGDEHRHRANCYWPINGTPVIGDWQTGDLYALDHRVHTDNGHPIKRVRSFPHVVNGGKRVFYRQFLADFDTGNSSAVAPATFSFLNASFDADNGTTLDIYISDVGGGWTAVGGATHAVIQSNHLIGDGGDALYVSDTPAPRADYSVRFSVVPPAYDSVPTGTDLFVVGRSTPTGAGYRLKVTANGTNYTLTLSVDGTATTATVVMGTLTSGIYTVWLVMRGTTITAQAQRSQDSLFLRDDATWQTNPGTTAAQFTDDTYTAPGTVAVGGTWPVPVPAVPAHLTFTPQTGGGADANFPSGYSYYSTIYGHGFQTFDFTRNVYYALISGTVSGVATIGVLIVDLSTMGAIRTVTLEQMYAGTAYGSPPGTRRPGSVWDITTGNDTDIYLLISPDKSSQYFVRVDAVTLKVTGELFGFGGHDLQSGLASKTATHTVVAYPTHAAFGLGLLLMDGAAMATIGHAATPIYTTYNAGFIPGARHPDGSCDFIMIDSDLAGSGDINLWRIKVSDSLVITSTMTGTFDATTVYDPNAGSTAWIGQFNYDEGNDAIILWLQQDINGPATWFTSINWDGSLNWSTYVAAAGTTWANRGQAQLTGTTLMAGPSTAPFILDTQTGAVIFTGTTATIGGGYYFHVWDASRSSYWTYILATYGFTRLDFIAATQPPTLAMDDVVATTEAALPSNLISLRWSDDQGYSYGNAISQSIGEAGEYRTSLQWNRCGMARSRVWELSWSVAAPVALLGGWFDATPGQS